MEKMLEFSSTVLSTLSLYLDIHTHTHPFNGFFSGTTRVSRYQKGKTNLDFTEARDSEWQWHQLGHMQVCISLQTDNHNNTPPLSFLQAVCPSCHPTNSVKALCVCVHVAHNSGLLLQMFRDLFICLWAHRHSLQKRLNKPLCCFGADFIQIQV